MVIHGHSVALHAKIGQQLFKALHHQLFLAHFPTLQRGPKRTVNLFICVHGFLRLRKAVIGQCFMDGRIFRRAKIQQGAIQIE